MNPQNFTKDFYISVKSGLTWSDKSKLWWVNGTTNTIFVFSTCHNLNSNWNWLKRRWCDWDSNPGRQNGRRRQIHWATAASPTIIPLSVIYAAPILCCNDIPYQIIHNARAKLCYCNHFKVYACRCWDLTALLTFIISNQFCQIIKWQPYKYWFLGCGPR